jgi:hypothetical protein
MLKKIILGIVAIIVIVVAVMVLKSNKSQQGTNNEEQSTTTNQEVTQESLDASIASTIEKLKTTCADFLAGDINDESNCPALDNLTYQNICHYCFAVKNQNPSLCERISDSAFYVICQKATAAK